MNPVAIFLIILFTAANSFSFFVGLAKTPPGNVFLGTVHYPPDFFFYLSQIAQGKMTGFWTYNLFTSERAGPTLLGWEYALMGRIGSTFFLSPVITYQLAVAVATVVFLVVSYKLITTLFPKNTTAQLVTFTLFLLSNAFPKLYYEGSRLVYSYYYPWNNFGHPFERLANVPHHILTQAAIAGTFFLFISWWNNPQKTRWYLVWAGVLGFFLGGVQPVQWILLATVILLTGFFVIYKKRHEIKNHLFSLLRTVYAPLVVFFLSGAPIAWYIKQAVAVPPYSVTAAWEAGSQVHIPLRADIILNGPLCLIALVGIPIYFRKRSLSTIVLFIYAALSFGIYRSLLPDNLGILNVRFQSAFHTLFLATATVFVIIEIARHTKKYASAVSWILAFASIGITLGVTKQQFIERNDFRPSDPSVYLSKNVMPAFSQATKLSTFDDTFLVMPPLADPFPAFTNRRVFWASANVRSTINFNEKDMLMNKFYGHQMTEEEKAAFFRKYGITFVAAFAWSPTDSPLLERVYQNDFLILYKVHTGVALLRNKKD
ncbi:hypothetical protein A2Z00_04125 [Candidatus Gottesmanbacteria bacterium RBG_13_45_10]|uniref:Glycosyltransferase RgtA/B/C/D-like domain-containing protein n=1 Tax=Candidatus Gottesmanbacteria bacterium RBG_13_45_10 TaxID=1798370 RepID=A0A1F5ZHZ9_9BACT|nr:MAG: hypothetical protein A2Z00_04125 [Candidatus Gottesmanbacteria bacterium RBG_13_45_10]